MKGSDNIAGKWVFHNDPNSIVVYLQNSHLFRYVILKDTRVDSLWVSYYCSWVNGNQNEQYFMRRFTNIASLHVSEDKTRDKISPYIKFHNDVIKQVNIAKENRTMLVRIAAREDVYLYL